MRRTMSCPMLPKPTRGPFLRLSGFRVACALASLAAAALPGCMRPGAPPRYAVTQDVRRSAQRAVVAGVVRCEDLWSRHPLGGVKVALFVEGNEAPLASEITAPDGVFQLTSDFLADPAHPGLLRIAGDGWSGEAALPAPLDQTFSVTVTALCPKEHPRGATMLSADVTIQPIPSPGAREPLIERPDR